MVNVLWCHAGMSVKLNPGPQVLNPKKVGAVEHACKPGREFPSKSVCTYLRSTQKEAQKMDPQLKPKAPAKKKAQEQVLRIRGRA